MRVVTINMGACPNYASIVHSFIIYSHNYTEGLLSERNLTTEIYIHRDISGFDVRKTRLQGAAMATMRKTIAGQIICSFHI